MEHAKYLLARLMAGIMEDIKKRFSLSKRKRSKKTTKEDAIKYVAAEKKSDVFVKLPAIYDLPARFGKSLLVVFSSVWRSSEKNIVIVIYPLPILFGLFYLNIRQ